MIPILDPAITNRPYYMIDIGTDEVRTLTETELARLLPPCPRAGSGVHRYLFRASCILREHTQDELMIVRLINEAVQGCGRAVDMIEIEQAVFNSSPDCRDERRSGRKWPKVDERRSLFAARCYHNASQELAKLSPFCSGNLSTADMISLLFPGDDLLCFGLDQKSSTTQRRSRWVDLDKMQFVVPSRMTSEIGRTKTGRLSPRCLDNTGNRDYLVVEFDSGGIDEQASKIMHLAERAPLVMVLFSGGKSLHGWFRCSDHSDDNLWDFMSYAVSIGADPHTWCPCQFVRTPRAKRENGVEQSVLYFNPDLKRVPQTKLATEWRFDVIRAADADLLDLEVFFEPQSQRYLFPSDGGWIPLSKENLEVQLIEKGYLAKKKKGESLSAIKRISAEVQRTKSLSYAGPLAGRSRGYRIFNGERILVTKTAAKIAPKSGEFPVLNQLIENLFSGEGVDQRPWVFGWLKVALQALDEEKVSPGQALVLAGPAGCGKSLFQTIVTELFGGRSAKPFRYMSGLTAFNSDLFAAEHLVIEDEPSSFNTAKRVEFGNRIKEVTVNSSHSCHPKGKQAVMLDPIWRLTISLNDEPEHLRILPPLDESTKDKLILLKVNKRPVPVPPSAGDSRSRLWETIIAELPAFKFWLLEWEIPSDLHDERYGIGSFHNPDLMRSLDELGPEMELLDLLRLHLRGGGEVENAWKGSASDLSTTLGALPAFRGLITFPGALGVYLSRLAKKFPDKIVQKRSARAREWVIDRSL